MTSWTSKHEEAIERAELLADELEVEFGPPLAVALLRQAAQFLERRHSELRRSFHEESERQP